MRITIAFDQGLEAFCLLFEPTPIQSPQYGIDRLFQSGLLRKSHSGTSSGINAPAALGIALCSIQRIAARHRRQKRLGDVCQVR